MTQIIELRTATAAAARPDASDAPPQVGSWELLRLLGEGQLAQVFQARPVGSAASQPASYALKKLHAPWDEDPRGLELLCREARVGRKVSHAHLVPILAASLHEPPWFVVMPCLEGSTLAQRLAAGGPPELPVALWIARQVAEGLEALHRAGWMHADVKPSNIFMSASGHVTLIDLGFAQRLSEMACIAQRPVLGTLSYIAPEMITANLPADIRSDIYSLGATLFEMLTGRVPFGGNNPALLALEHRQGLPADLRILAPQLPTRVARLVRQMLSKEPLRRPQTPRELIDRLAALEIETFAERAA